MGSHPRAGHPSRSLGKLPKNSLDLSLFSCVPVLALNPGPAPAEPHPRLLFPVFIYFLIVSCATACVQRSGDILGSWFWPSTLSRKVLSCFCCFPTYPRRAGFWVTISIPHRAIEVLGPWSHGTTSLCVFTGSSLGVNLAFQVPHMLICLLGLPRLSYFWFFLVCF